MRGENQEEIHENRKWENIDFSVKVDLYIWKQIKNDDDDDDENENMFILNFLMIFFEVDRTTRKILP